MTNKQLRKKERDHVRKNTAVEVNLRIENEMRQRIREYLDRPKSEIAARIDQLEKEWDIERILESNASTLSFLGFTLGTMVNKKWLILPGIVLPFLLQHAIQGWCPPVPVLRRLGFRTKSEIEREKYALKLLRGDFDRTCQHSRVKDPDTRIDKIMQALTV